MRIHRSFEDCVVLVPDRLSHLALLQAGWQASLQFGGEAKLAKLATVRCCFGPLSAAPGMVEHRLRECGLLRAQRVIIRFSSPSRPKTIQTFSFVWLALSWAREAQCIDEGLGGRRVQARGHHELGLSCS